ncbi:MarR family transcriptional regulator [Microvirga sp. W0021]|uniref:MarR family transcriptional regulator n=1 Tax=Hohaiivirga grylli TaxID=3133970 RepID=A0ABV0BJT6_9HYPH
MEKVYDPLHRSELIELLFFAYRDFVSDPDRNLSDFGFGRAHHRVLHFVHLHPGLTIAELLDILRITKQSLNRVLKELIQKGFIESKTGTSDRRQRLLYATATGIALSQKLSDLQGERIKRAFSTLPDGTSDIVCKFLLAMIDPYDQDHVTKLVYGPPEAKS